MPSTLTGWTTKTTVNAANITGEQQIPYEHPPLNPKLAPGSRFQTVNLYSAIISRSDVAEGGVRSER
ncbi:MAG: hypothetical protein WKF84_05530 [Pyrinomonadaceae bacterium]